LEKSDTRKNVELLLLLAGPGLILLGIIYQTIYYATFNIEITRYMELSEIILSFTNELLLLIILIIWTCGFILFTWNTQPNPTKKLPLFKAMIHDLKAFIKTHLIDIIIALAIIIFLIISILFAQFFIFIGLIAVIVFILIKAKFYLQKGVSEYFKIKSFSRSIFEYIVLLLGLIVCFAYLDAKSLVKNERYINSVIYFKNDTIRSTQYKFYIGQTNKYIFVYDLKNDITTVYPMSDVTKLEFGKIIYLKDQYKD